MGTTVALCVISSSRKVDPSFEEYLKTTVLGNQIWFEIHVSTFLVTEAKKAWPDLVDLSESMHQLFGHSFEVRHSIYIFSENGS